MKNSVLNLTIYLVVVLAAVASATSQSLTRELRIAEGETIAVVNPSGRVYVSAQPEAAVVTLTAESADGLGENEIKVEAGGYLRIETLPTNPSKRIDLSLVVPERVKLKIETREGEVRVTGDLAAAEVRTGTGTIAADVPTDDLRYDFFWTASRPRFLSDIELDKVKERSGGKFQLKGRFRSNSEHGDPEKTEDAEIRTRQTKEKGDSGAETASRSGDGTETSASNNLETRTPVTGSGDESDANKKPRSKTVALNFTTERGIVLLNVPPNEVSSDLRERPLTDAAKAIIRSGDVVLMDAIRRASPKYFGEYSRTLPPVKREPFLSESATQRDVPGETINHAVVRVTDMSNRAIADLKLPDFTVTEAGSQREILAVRPHTAPVNLVLLLDVSGSVDNYVNFIRKAARSFIDTAREGDRISLVLFNEDVKVLSGFSTNKQRLSESLDTFDAGGATAYYDAIAYTLADTLRPLKGDRTAIVVLTDGDDNRSFLSFDSLVGAIEESGALIYPLYVPSALIAASETNDPEKGIDPLRTRYMTLSARAEGEGERLAKVSGGVYYPITQLSQIQKAYDDIVSQIRTAYTLTFRSGFQADPNNRPSPRLKIRVNKPNAFVQVSSVSPVQN